MMIHSDLLKRLLPPASYDPGGPLLATELAAEGAALDMAQARAEQLLPEMDPRTVSVTLADWERVYGLPDRCVSAAGIVQSFSERIAALVALVTLHGGQSRAFFIALAAAIGYTITITELTPTTTEMDSDLPTYDEQYRFVWVVNSALYNLRDETSEDDTEMATAVWGNVLLECRINKFKPAHTLALFAYT